LRLRLPAGAVLRHLTCLHSADGLPFICEDRWLNPAALDGQQPDFAAQSANEWLVANMPYNAGDIAFSAAGAGADDAAAFGIDPGTPLFMVERATWTADTAITFVRLAYAPGYRLHMTL
jgi:GntR family histidine utilization transcriptional repressor